jgi:hypothetical protein
MYFQIDAVLSNVRSFKEDGLLGAGMIDFQVTMSSGGPDSAEVPTVAAIYVQEVIFKTQNKLT